MMEPLISYTILVVALTFLLRTIIIHFLDKDVEKFKTDLKHEHDKKLGEFKNALQIKAIEHQIRFGNVYEKQSLALFEVYQCLLKLKESVASYLNIFESAGEPSKKDKLNIVVKDYEEFSSKFYPNKILFPLELDEKIASCGNCLVEAANIFTKGQEKEQLLLSGKRHLENDNENIYEYWDDAIKKFQENVSPTLKELESEFRNMLGVKDLN